MLDALQDVVAKLDGVVGSLEPAAIEAPDAMRLVEMFARIERFAAAGRTIAAGRVMETRGWYGSGARSAGEWVASKTRAGLKDAIDSLETARALADLPRTRAALVAGTLSAPQAAEIAMAATADPAAEERLLDVAARESFKELRAQCRMVIAAAAADEDVAERIRRSRYFKHWTDHEGAVRLDARLTPEDGARLVSVVTSMGERIAGEARTSEQREPMRAYCADALVRLVDGEPGPRANVHVRVDNEALQRGHTVAGDTCEIDGIGPITVRTAQQLAGDGIVKALACDEADVTRVAHLGRTIPSRLRTALEERDRTCVVPGCDVRSGLQIDHVVPFVDGGPTELSNLARLCAFHHAGKTHHGWVLEGRPGAWTWTRKGRARGP